jgi:hypothetical protein
MKRALMAIVLIGVAGCSSGSSEPGAGQSGTIAVPSASETTALSPAATTPSATLNPSSEARPATSAPTPAASTGKGDTTFCDYLASTAAAQQQIEDPDELVKLVEGAQAVAPGAISEDLALYAQSVKKLALTVTGSPDQAAKADAWLSRNDAAIAQAELNLNSYSESVCGTPFLAGEG